MVDEETSAGSSRRALLARGVTLVAAAGIPLAGCGSGRHHHRLLPPDPARDTPLVRALLAALELERRTIAAYAAGIPLLPRRPREAAKRFLDFELSHAGEIAGLIAQAGVKPPKTASAFNLGQPGSPTQVLRLLRDLEHQQLTMYLGLVPQVHDGKTRAALTAVLGGDAQHLALLTQLLGGDPLPVAIP